MLTALSILVILIAAALPALIWLVFFRAEDCHPEPKRVVVYTFAVGALMSLPVLALQLVFQQITGTSSDHTIILIIGLAVIEETFKFLAAYWAVGKNPAFDEPVDAMVYLMAAGLGFATIENLFIVGKSLDLLQAATFGPTIQTLLLRFVGATLLHTLTSALVGYYWARGRLVLRGVRDRIHTSAAECVVMGIVLATVIHTGFNWLVLRFQKENLLYPSLFLIGFAFFVIEDFERLRDDNASVRQPPQ
jgi:RsiW-degrading membrane proteinase PrsW (M82 family)